MIFRAPEAPGPVSDCRSHLKDSDGIIKSLGNLHGASLVTIQGTELTLLMAAFWLLVIGDEQITTGKTGSGQ